MMQILSHESVNLTFSHLNRCAASYQSKARNEADALWLKSYSKDAFKTEILKESQKVFGFLDSGSVDLSSVLSYTRGF